MEAESEWEYGEDNYLPVDTFSCLVEHLSKDLVIKNHWPVKLVDAISGSSSQGITLRRGDDDDDDDGLDTFECDGVVIAVPITVF